MKEEQRVLKKIASSVPFFWSVILKSLITGHVKSKATIFLLKFIADHQLQNVPVLLVLHFLLGPFKKKQQN